MDEDILQVLHAVAQVTNIFMFPKINEFQNWQCLSAEAFVKCRFYVGQLQMQPRMDPSVIVSDHEFLQLLFNLWIIVMFYSISKNFNND